LRNYTKRKIRQGKKGNAAAVIITLIAVAVIIRLIAGFFYTNYLKITYPKKYSEYVREYSAEYNIAENLVYAVIKTESSFNPDAESNAGARGLMQIMKDTFDWIKYKLKDKSSVSYDDMYDAETNIKYGCYFLGYLNGLYGGDIVCISAAYHAGSGSVTSWLNNRQYSDDGKTLKKIPIADTEHYVYKIEKAYKIYCELT
jgi:soluble lytic murein transglycosylase